MEYYVLNLNLIKEIFLDKLKNGVVYFIKSNNL
uniref:Uncharacterized protein n=1 Tax=viral metagenome TaxID=1070528 RepID=A0A6C0AGE1_9ZZZZ